MDYRENAGYIITDSCHVGDSEFVLGVHLTAPQQFVTWKCTGRTDYYWGHYFSDLFSAQKDLVARAQEEVQCVPFPVSWTVKMKKKQKETQDILSYHTQAAGCSDKARAKASGGRQPIEECGRTGL